MIREAADNLQDIIMCVSLTHNQYLILKYCSHHQYRYIMTLCIRTEISQQLLDESIHLVYFPPSKWIFQFVYGRCKQVVVKLCFHSILGG